VSASNTRFYFPLVLLFPYQRSAIDQKTKHFKRCFTKSLKTIWCIYSSAICSTLIETTKLHQINPTSSTPFHMESG